MGIARVASRAQLGSRGAASRGRSASRRRAADLLHRRAARHGGERKQGSRARGAREFRLRISRRAASPSISRRPICPRKAAATTCRSRSASCWRRRRSNSPTALLDALRVLRRARAGRRAQADQGRVAGGRACGARRRAASSCPRPICPRRALRRRPRARRSQFVRTCARCWLAARSRGGACADCRLPRHPRRAAGRCAARSRRRARPGRSQTRTADRRGRWPQPVAGRPARHRQEHAGAAAAGPAAGARRRRGARRRVHRLGEQPRLRRRATTAAGPFRAPHHTASAGAIIGGGPHARPGRSEPRASRRAVPRRTAGVQPAACSNRLREPLESGVVAISRAALQVEYPARFQLVAAMNPCPCGYLGEPPGAAAARRRRSRVTARASPGRCSIASTCASKCRRCRAKSC